MRKKEQQKGREEGRERRMYIAFFSVLGIIAVFCVWRLYIIYFVQYGASAASYREVREAALEEEGLRAAALLRTDPPDTPEELDVKGAVAAGGGSRPPSVDFSVLLEMDQNVVGWLSVPAIDVEYPVMQYKDDAAYKEEHGEEYYLNRTIGGEPLYAGSIFMDSQSLASLEDPSTVIFGHNIKNGMMFGRLKELKEQEAVDADPRFWIVRSDRILLSDRPSTLSVASSRILSWKDSEPELYSTATMRITAKITITTISTHTIDMVSSNAALSSSTR